MIILANEKFDEVVTDETGCHFRLFCLAIALAKWPISALFKILSFPFYKAFFKPLVAAKKGSKTV